MDEHRALRSVELHILLSVVDQPRHGYAILQEAEERTGGRPGFEIPTLYRALRRLREEGWIAVVDREAGVRGPQRETYGATEQGRGALAGELQRMEVALSVGRARLAGAGDAGS